MFKYLRFPYFALLIVMVSLLGGLVATSITALAAPNENANERATSKSACMIPNGGDSDNNGIGDAGVQVVCNYTSVYAYDANGDWYWDLGDGRVLGTVGSIDALDQETLSQCDYQIHSKGDFGNNPFMDSGEISNMIHCHGYDGSASYHYQIVHETDPRYTGNPDWTIWGTWEYHVLTESGEGNLVRVPLVGN